MVLDVELCFVCLMSVLVLEEVYIFYGFWYCLVDEVLVGFQDIVEVGVVMVFESGDLCGQCFVQLVMILEILKECEVVIWNGGMVVLLRWGEIFVVVVLVILIGDLVFIFGFIC